MDGQPVEYIGGFEVLLFPRFTDDLGSEAVQENLFTQASLWNALHILAVCERSISVELRTVSGAEDGSIGIFILLIGRAVDAPMVQEVGRLLPRDYAYEPMSEARLKEIVHPSSPDGWRVARVHRRAQFVDLPSLLQADDQPLALAVGSGPSHGSLLFNLPVSDPKRHLPENREDCISQLDTTRFCLPLLGEMKEFPSDRRRVYEELQASAPAIVSVTLHAFPNADIEEDRQVATRFRDLLEGLGAALDNSGFAHAQSLRRVYDRYFLTKEYISLVTIRVAAMSDAQAVAVAHQLCAWLGGMRAFSVLAPTRSFPDISTVLNDLRLELPAGAKGPEWLPKIERLRRTMEAQDVVPVADQRYDRFLVRLPHVYTLEEVGQLMRLPFGQEQGLPGLRTRMLAPFYPSSFSYNPVLSGAGEHRPAPADQIRIGRLNPSSTLLARDSETGLHWHSIPVRDLTKHALVVGSTGSGKTVTTLFFMRELVRLQIPFLVIEPVKTEYYDSLKKIPGLAEGPQSLKRYNFEGSKGGGVGRNFLAFDPMRLQEGVTVARHVSYLKTCFEAAFPMESWQSLLLENAMLEYYRDKGGRGCGLNLFTRGSRKTLRVEEATKEHPARVFPSFATFSSFLLGHFLDKEFGKGSAQPKSPSGDLVENMRQMFKRRFQNLGAGPLGQAFRIADEQTIKQRALYEHFTHLLSRPSVIELDAIPDGEQKSLVMAFLMTFLYERRQVDDYLAREKAGDGPLPAGPPVRHVLVIEEAHRLLAHPGQEGRGDTVGMGAQAKAVSLFVDMLAEIRAFRQSLLIVEQIPTKLVPAAVKNTNLKIMLRITSRDDRDYLGEAMSFNEEQKKFVSSLRAEPSTGAGEDEVPGQVQFVAFDENVEQPVLLSLPLRSPAEGRRWLFDEYFQG